MKGSWYNKTNILCFLFNIINYSLEVINIQRHEAALNIILLRVNNYNIEKKKKSLNICFIICHQHHTRSGKLNPNKTQQISVTTQVSFVKTETTTHSTTTPYILLYIILLLYYSFYITHFILLLLIFFSEISNPWKK